MKPPLPPENIEQETRQRYSGGTYDTKTICKSVAPDSPVYTDQMLALRYQAVEELCTPQSAVMDLCCATGWHLLEMAPRIESGVGVDFSEPFLAEATRLGRETGVDNISFTLANARFLPFQSGSFDVIYCFSSLYYIPRVWEVMNEVARLLRPGGHFVGDFGAYYSLNTIVSLDSEKTSKTSYPVHLPFARITGMMAEAGLEIVSLRSFQILPMWGNRPPWLRPLLWPVWIKLLQKKVGGKMLDEWISSLPGLRRLAFRQVLVCRKL